MEINARTISGNQLAISAGVDFPWIGYQYLTGRELPAEMIRPQREPVKWINEELEVQRYLLLRKSGAMTFWSWLGSLRGAKSKALWAWDDPLPLIAGVGRLLLMLTRRIASIMALR